MTYHPHGQPPQQPPQYNVSAPQYSASANPPPPRPRSVAGTTLKVLGVLAAVLVGLFAVAAVAFVVLLQVS